MYLQLIIHELGHLIFGLLSGYKFSSFRIGNIILLKHRKKLKFKKLKIAGTAGQCLMSPPEIKDGKVPVFLYNLGGALLNLISCVIFFIIYIFTKENNYLSIIFELSIESISPARTPALRPLLIPTVATGTPGGILTVVSI